MATQTNKKDISIVIVNYKSWKHLRNCLQSLDFQSEEFSFEVVVVDNVSNDGQLSVFKEEFPNVFFAENTGNNGFANGSNVGADYSIGEYLLFLNPDTIANEEAIKQMWLFAKKNPTIGAISCVKKKPNGGYEKSERTFTTAATLFGLIRAILRIFNKNQSFSEDKVLYTDWVSGSLLFTSKEWFQHIEGWNEDYWMYYEDMDLCKRVQKANGKVALLESVDIVHNHGGASRINMKTASLTKTEVQISKHVYVNNHFKGFEKFISLLIMVVYSLVSRLLMGILGLVLFFIPKMRLNVYLLTKTIRYYFGSLYRISWLSTNSMNLKTK